MDCPIPECQNLPTTPTSPAVHYGGPGFCNSLQTVATAIAIANDNAVLSVANEPRRTLSKSDRLIMAMATQKPTIRRDDRAFAIHKLSAIAAPPTSTFRVISQDRGTLLCQPNGYAISQMINLKATKTALALKNHTTNRRRADGEALIGAKRIG